VWDDSGAKLATTDDNCLKIESGFLPGRRFSFSRGKLSAAIGRIRRNRSVVARAASASACSALHAFRMTFAACDNLSRSPEKSTLRFRRRLRFQLSGIDQI
jgi:hypothetical protein